jgi:2-hydroxy-3-keto-5-methylthiopentenyl-1-phosphate phosphatase
MNGILNTYGRCIVIADFDGTITKQDSNVELLKVFGVPQNDVIEELFIAGKMGTREAMQKHFDLMHFTEDQYIDFIFNNIQIDPGFKTFHQKLSEAGIPLVVLSGGYANAINAVFNREGLTYNKVLANTLVFQGKDIKIEFYHDKVTCLKSFGPCGNCKATHITNYKQCYDSIIFIGDGLTDRCAADKADHVFAKDKLAYYCKQNGISYTPYVDFNDVTRLLLQRG